MMMATALFTKFAVCRAAHRLGAAALVPGPYSCGLVHSLAERTKAIEPQYLPLLPVWDCDRDERCECGWRAVEKEK